VSKLGHVRALNGLRGVAILLVVGRHAFPNVVNGGGYGVDLFFVLSGFLITTLLLEERAQTGRISLRSFYRRRAWRLFPALASLLVVFLLIEVVRGDIRAGVRAVLGGGFYTANIAQTWFPSLIGSLPLGPLWSLAEEEQFYLLWPLLLIAVAWWRVPDRIVARLLGGLILLVVVEGIVLAHFDGAWGARVYAAPDTHSGGLLMGALVAFVLRRPASSKSFRFDRRLGTASLVVLVPLVLVLWLPFPYESLFFNLAAAGLVVVAVCQPDARFARFLSSRVLVWFGRVSYSLYLWHVLWLWLFGWHNRGIALLLAFATAYASTRWFEEPLRKRGRLRAAPEAVAVLMPAAA
jgi:peptidoglycan/LPS O-acetylase OafA/YrhL